MRPQLQALRAAMAARGIDAYLVPTADPHGSESVGDHFACRAWVSGFTGSAGTLLVFPQWAGLWTDGRYFLQARDQLAGSGIRLMEQGQPGVPTIEDFLRDSLQHGQTLGFDGRCVDAWTGSRYAALARRRGARIEDRLDLVGEIWTDRPPRTARPIWAMDPQWSGRSRRDKLARLRADVQNAGCTVHLLTSLPDIAWLLDLRGDDIACTPVFLAYFALTPVGCTLFVQPEALSPALRDALAADGVAVRDYDGFYDFVAHLPAEGRVLLDTRRVNLRVLAALPEGLTYTDAPDPTDERKAVKTPAECAGSRRAHLADGLALTRFMHWLKTNVGRVPMTERSAAEQLETFRRADPDYLGPSFAPILAYGPHGAIVHYSATAETDAPLAAESFLLADTGGHYRCGTTDCTRTYALGPLTDEQRTHYTAVLRGHLALGAVTFRAGCTGRDLDVLARQPLWALGLDYDHGTGHGVGHVLSVHEGPQSISRRSGGREVPLRPGMITSNEPGLYLAGRYGIRLEDLTLCVERQPGFLGFETLTCTPFDRDAIAADELTAAERALLDGYHAWVRETLTPLLPPDEAAWLAQATRPL